MACRLCRNLIAGVTAASKGAAWIAAGLKALAGFRGFVAAGTRVIAATLKPISSNLRLFHTALGNLVRRVRPGSRDWVRFSGVLRDAARGKGDFGLGAPVSRRDATILGRAWVGKGARQSSTGVAWISKDGLRQWRPPAFKKGSGVWQSNLQARWVPRGEWQCNGHLVS